MNKKRLLELAGVLEEAQARYEVNHDVYNEIKRLLSQSTMMLGEERTLSDEERKKYNTLLTDILSKVKTLHTISYNAQERFKNKK